MRIKITFRLTDRNQILPLNYKYPVSSWIYKVLASSNKEFTDRLHQYGYKIENGKKFKLFTFSDFIVPKGKWKIIGDRMKIWADTITLIVAFQLPEQIQNFIAGLFSAQDVAIGDKISRIKMTVQNVEILNTDLPQNDTYTFKCLSPVFMAKKIEGKKYRDFISPDNPDFERIFINNLIEKYNAHCLQTNTKPKEINAQNITFKSLHKNPKSVKQTIKAFKKEQTEIRAFKFHFKLQAPKEIVETGLNAGFGAENAQGFGCYEVIEEKG